MYEYGVIGNCQINALISDRAAIKWLCLPQPDSPPVFGQLLDPDAGEFSITSADGSVGKQQYISNTNILETIFVQKDGAAFKVTDFCPRFEQFGRIYRPPMIVRILTPLNGSCSIKVTCNPINGWSKEPLKVLKGNSHFRYEPTESQMRLTTTMPLTFINSDQSHIVTEPLYFILSWGLPVEADIKTTAIDFFQQTERYWNTWVKHCSIPTLYQSEVIRSALALKIHCYEDTGAILASLTTSLPEEYGHVRNWDYRFCWIRDAYFALSAFHNLGHFEEMEGFIRFILGIAHSAKEEILRPVYRLDGRVTVPEILHENWTGFENSAPVRSGNEAGEHTQFDVYGETILTLSPLFFDDRFIHLRNQDHLKLLGRLARQCIDSLGKADAGVWEFRHTWMVHSFSTLLSWAGIDRFERIVNLGFLPFDKSKLAEGKELAINLLQKAVVEGAVRNAIGDPSYDASLSMMAVLRFPDKKLTETTLRGLFENLAVTEPHKAKGFLYRYLKHDDFGRPKSAFLACSFWVSSAFAAIGDVKTATQVLERSFEARNNLGLYSEHYDPFEKKQLGNFPQAYSHMGLINAAFAVSPPWSHVL